MTDYDPEFRSMRGRNVTAFPSSWFQEFRAWIEQQRAGKCDVHWGRHSCVHVSGVKPHKHLCKCGQSPYPTSVLWGNDLTEQEIAERTVRQNALAKREIYESWADPFDQYGNLNPNRKRRGVKNEQSTRLVA